LVFRGSFTLAELPTSPSEGPVVSQILPIIPSIQPISSRAPGDRDYQFYTNPIWEPSQKSTPFWEYTSPQKPFPSDMDNPSPTTTDDSGMPGDEIPSTMDSTYVSRNTSTGGLPLGYKALRDFISTPFPTSIWSPPVFSNTEPSTLPPHSTTTISVTTPPLISVASSTPVISRPSSSLFAGFDPTSNASLGGQYDQYLPPFGPETGQLSVGEISVPLSIDWGSTSYHGGQASYAQPEIPHQQYPQGQSSQGNPFASSGTSFTIHTQPIGNPGHSSIPQAQPGL